MDSNTKNNSNLINEKSYVKSNNKKISYTFTPYQKEIINSMLPSINFITSSFSKLIKENDNKINIKLKSLKEILNQKIKTTCRDSYEYLVYQKPEMLVEVDDQEESEF